MLEDYHLYGTMIAMSRPILLNLLFLMPHHKFWTLAEEFEFPDTSAWNTPHSDVYEFVLWCGLQGQIDHVLERCRDVG